MKKLFTLFACFLPLSFAHAENTDLLALEPTPVTPKFSYQAFANCSEFEQTMQTLLASRNMSAGESFRAVSTMDMAKATTPATPTVAQVPYSQTNIQVAGIDEADTIKTDGKYLYRYHEGEHAIIILDAQNLSRINTIAIPPSYMGTTFYITKNRLILTATQYRDSQNTWGMWYDNSEKSIIAIYDTSIPASAKLTRLIQVDGRLADTRLADNGLMTAVIATSYWTPPRYHVRQIEPAQYTYLATDMIPRISDSQYVGSKKTATNRGIADCSGMASILPDKATLSQYSFSPVLTSILRFDTTVPSSRISSQSVLSEAGQIHVTGRSVYLTSNLWQPRTTGSCMEGRPCASKMIWNPGTSSTLVHRFGLNNAKIRYTYSSLISGYPLNQYSMDEDSSGNFRIVTSDMGEKSSTRLTILGTRGAVLSTLSGIAPGENFQSSRFIDNRLYLVTFERIDPFFVIDLTRPESPSILGELKIPGYSTYLHPYDSNRLIGIGYDTFVNAHGGTQNGGLKIDLYNVSDIKNPKQEQSLTLGDAGSSSDALSDPHAFVWYPAKNLLLLPATLMASAGDRENPYLSKSAFQGIVGVSITPNSINEKFRITHISRITDIQQDWKKSCGTYPSGSTYSPSYCSGTGTIDSYFAQNLWNYSSDFITRALYVGDTLYSVGNSAIKSWDIAAPITPKASAPFTSSQTKSPIYPVPMMAN